MRLVPALGLGEREQDLALLAGAAPREVAVDGGLGALVGEVAAATAAAGPARPGPLVRLVGLGRHGRYGGRGC